MANKAKIVDNHLEVQNAVKTMFANIRFSSPDRPIRSIVLTSSVPNEGKTVTSIQLAQAIAGSTSKRVCLVEADMRHRSLGIALNVAAKRGVYSVLTGAVQLEDAVVKTKVKNLYFLDVEPSIPNPVDLLSSKSYIKLVKMLEESFDYVVFDAPPVGVFVDAAFISALVDGTILVFKPGLPKRSDLQMAYDQLSKVDANILGICTTFSESSSSEYFYAYYSQQSNKDLYEKSKMPGFFDESGQGGVTNLTLGQESKKTPDPLPDHGKSNEQPNVQTNVQGRQFSRRVNRAHIRQNDSGEDWARGRQHDRDKG
jgi:capsular exopolysaccharide synthesis family protein